MHLSQISLNFVLMNNKPFAHRFLLGSSSGVAFAVWEISSSSFRNLEAKQHMCSVQCI